ncbi:MAG: hypothetical protein RL637_1790 [Pseudomonadota bacterium]|jgi:3-phenylpropionate/trans-cinnamate dioxygenase ferredoxin subunit
MSEWIKVANCQQLANGEHLIVELKGQEIVLFKHDNQFYAIEDRCSHDNGSIAQGQIEAGEIICPRHGARFCLKTGQYRSPPAYENISCFPVLVNNESVYVAESAED